MEQQEEYLTPDEDYDHSVLAAMMWDRGKPMEKHEEVVGLPWLVADEGPRPRTWVEAWQEYLGADVIYKKKEQPVTEVNKVVDGPDYYQIVDGLEVKHIESALAKKYPDLDGYVFHRWMAALEYLIRWPGKNGTEDLEKVIWQVKEILHYKEKQDEND